MKEKWVSIIIPVYNTEKYLEECLNSVVNQTIGMEHIELILVDDGSTDNSYQCLLRYEQQYPKDVVLYHLERNSGQAVARNIGIAEVTAPYFLFVDSDDWMELDICEKMLEPANKYHCDWIQCFYMEHIKGEEPRHSIAINEPIFYKIHNEAERNQFLKNCGDVGGMIGIRLFRTEWFRQNKFEFKPFRKYEDNYLSGIIEYFCNSCYILPEALYHYRILEFSNSHSRNDEGHFDRLNVELEKLKYYCQNELFHKYYHRIRENFLRSFYENTLHIIMCQFDYIPLERIQQMQSIVKDIFPDYLEYCKQSDKFINSVITVGFKFPLEIWESYKKAYLDWVREEKEDGLIQFYVGMRKALGFNIEKNHFGYKVFHSPSDIYSK